MNHGFVGTIIFLAIATAGFYIALNNASGVKSIAGTATTQYKSFAQTAQGR